MSEQGVDLSQIRGDWKFHMDYLTNAVTQTIKRQMNYWDELSTKVKNPALEGAVRKQADLWDELIAGANDKGTIPTADSKVVEFIAVCRDAKPVCDELQDTDESELVEEFSEACRQTRGLCDDLEMMREQRPEDQ
jgi:hypothetical protein